jgi:WD40 repeat protein
VSALAFSPDGKTLISGSRDDTLKVWSLATGRELRSLDHGAQSVPSVAVSPDGSLLAAAPAVGDIRIRRLY